MSKLITHNGGNAHDCAQFSNIIGLADYVHQFVMGSGSQCVIVFKVPDEKVREVWRKLGKEMEHCPIQLQE